MGGGGRSAVEVPFVSLDRQFHNLRVELAAAFERVGSSGSYILGEEIERFEAEAAAYCGARFALGVANGSDALFLALKALGIGAGDEVVTCPNSFIASAGAVVAAGARPVFVDAAEDYNIDPGRIEAAITTRTRALLPVHLTGRPADMDAISTIARKHRLVVVEDAAQAIGARYRGRRVGSLGTIAGFSLHPLKNLGALGDGGLLTTDDANLHTRMARLRNHGLRSRDECEVWGYNSRLDSLQAAFASVKLRYLDGWNRRCREIASRYRDGLGDLVWVPRDRGHEEPVYHNFIIRADRREELMEHLNRCGVGTRIHYPIPIHMQECASSLGHKAGDFPEVERQAATILSLPIFPELADAEVEYVIRSTRSFFE
jgi:dTDP-4-amino-4,6-dideoxygalactose transaminase